MQQTGLLPASLNCWQGFVNQIVADASKRLLRQSNDGSSERATLVARQEQRGFLLQSNLGCSDRDTLVARIELAGAKKLFQQVEIFAKLWYLCMK